MQIRPIQFSLYCMWLAYPFHCYDSMLFCILFSTGKAVHQPGWCSWKVTVRKASNSTPIMKAGKEKNWYVFNFLKTGIRELGMSQFKSKFDNSDTDAWWDGRGISLWTYRWGYPPWPCVLSHNCELSNWLIALFAWIALRPRSPGQSWVFTPSLQGSKCGGEKEIL